MSNMVSDEWQANLAGIQSILDAYVANGAPGISAAIYTSRKGCLDFSAGYKDVRTQSKLNPASPFGIGSITKVFIAIVILQMVEEEKLSLDDQASEILGPGVLNNVQNARFATIKDLLSHHGTIPSWEDDPNWIRDGRRVTIQPQKIWKKDEAMRYLETAASADLTVGKYHYANTNYTILGLVIERVTQSTAEQEIRRRILQPLAMVDTYFEGFEHPVVDRTPRRYHWATEVFRSTAGISSYFSRVRDGLIDVTGTNLSVSWAAGGMVSSAGDILKFAVAIQKGKLLNPVSMAILMDWKDADEEKDIGCGIFRLRHAPAEGIWVGHNGGVLGFSSALWWNPDGSCAVSVVSNVGASHAGPDPPRAAHIIQRTKLLKFAAKLSKDCA